LIKENPALKLHTLLEEAYRYQSTTELRKVWADVFGLETTDTIGILLNYQNLLKLYSETKECIEGNELLNDSRNLQYLAQIKNALAQFDLNGTIARFRNSLNSEVLTALHYISGYISFTYSLNKSDFINQDQLNELVDDVDSLIDNISNSSLPADVKILLIKNLNKMRESFLFYKVSGIEGVRTALEQSIGSMIINREEISTHNKDENVKNVFSLFAKLNDILSTFNGAKDLIGPVAKMFIE
jgi:hypothetical protein